MGPDLSRQPGRILVEFVGLPGAGKSALSEAVAGELSAAGMATAQPARDTSRLPATGRALRKAALAVRAAAASPIGAARWGRALLATDQRATVDYVRVALNWFYVAGLVRDGWARPGAQLFDQGPVQGLWSVAYASGPRPMDRQIAASALRAILSPPSLIVVVRTGPAILADRLRRRPGGDSRLERDLARGDAGAYDRATGALTWVEELLDRLARPGEIEVGRASGEREAELGLTARRIAEQARRLIGTGP